MGRFRRYLDRTYQPQVAPWKRPVLLWVSLLVAVGCLIAAWAQLNHHFTNDGVWLAIGLFGGASAIGLGVAVFGDDWCVAMFLGGA